MTKPKALRVIVLVAALVVPVLFLVNRAFLQEGAPPPAAGGEWTTLSGNAARTGEGIGPEPMTNPAVHWQFGDNQNMEAAVASPPLVADGNVYVYTGPGNEGPVIALDPATGNERWRVDVGQAVLEGFEPFTAAAGGGVLYVAGTEGESSGDNSPPGAIYALDAATGQETWRHSFGEGLALTPPAVVGDTLYVAGDGYERGVVYAFDAATGAERWKVALGEDVGISEPVAVADGTVYVHAIAFDRGGVLLALAADTGIEQWRVETDGYPWAAPAVAGDGLFLLVERADYSDSQVRAFDRASGAERWRAAFPGYPGKLVVSDGTVYVDTEPGRILALDAASGSERWRADGLGLAMAAAGVLYAIDSSSMTGPGLQSGHLVAVDPATGAESWRLEGAGAVTAAGAGMFFAIGMDGLAAIGDGTGEGEPVARQVAIGAPPEAGCIDAAPGAAECVGAAEAVAEAPMQGEGPPIEATIAGEGPPIGFTGSEAIALPIQPMGVETTIVIANPDGSGVVPAVQGEYPAWSPDGTRIAFGGGSGDVDIHLMNADGSDQTVLVPVPGYDSLPSWSPDGGRITFVDGYGVLYVVNADGTDLRKLTESGEFWSGTDVRPVWSPDGTKIAYVANYGTEIWTINADGTAPTRIAGATALAPVWSTDGTRIAYLNLAPDPQRGNPAGGLWVMNADGSGKTKLADVIPESRATMEGWGPAWSPDGSRLLFASERPGEFASNLYVVNLDGTGLTKLLGLPADGKGEPVWSPDGTRIAFTDFSEVDVEEGYIGRDVYVMNADGSDSVTRLNFDFEDTSPVWSPDGSRIAFVGWPYIGGGD